MSILPIFGCAHKRATFPQGMRTLLFTLFVICAGLSILAPDIHVPTSIPETRHWPPAQHNGILHYGSVSQGTDGAVVSNWSFQCNAGESDIDIGVPGVLFCPASGYAIELSRSVDHITIEDNTFDLAGPQPSQEYVKTSAGTLARGRK